MFDLIDFEVNSTKEDKKYLSKIAKFLAVKYSFNKKIKFTIILTNSKNMIKLNKKFRDRKKDAQSLSFPILSNKDFINPQKYVNLGDVFINYPLITGKDNFLEALKWNLVHSFLHLLSYDHQNDYQETKMERETKKILEALSDK